MTGLRRKRLAFMSIVNVVKGFLKKVSDVSNIFLSDCVDDVSLVNYTVLGNSLQESTPTPEVPINVESVGEYDEGTEKYKIPITCSGKNIFDKKGFCSAYNSYGTLKATLNDSYLGENCFSYYAKHPSNTASDFTWLKGNFKEKTQYTISCYASFEYINLENRAIPFMAVKYTDGTIFSVTGQLSSYGFTKVTVVTDADKTIDYLYIQNFASVCKVYLKDLQIEEGDVATEYEKYREPVTLSIYLNEPLRKVGNYADIMEFDKGIVRRVINEKVFTGENTEAWNIWTQSVTENSSGVYYRNSSELGTYTNPKIITIQGYSNYFVPTPYSLASQNDSLIGMCCISGVSNPPYIAFKVPFKTIDDWLQWLKDKYAANNPLKVYLVYNEPINMKEKIPKLPTFKGSTIYTIGTQVQPSAVEVSYYSKSKE